MAKKNARPRDMANDILDVVREGTKKWTRARKAEERNPVSRSYRVSRMTRQKGVSVKEAAAEIMERAYTQVSGHGQLPANARQIMYAARGHIQKVTGRQLESNYFTQTLLPDYVQQTGVSWDIVYDDRGHFSEPHTEHAIGLGTISVRNYLAGRHEPSLVHSGDELVQARYDWQMAKMYSE
jgi:hypothetical protein